MNNRRPGAGIHPIGMCDVCGIRHDCERVYLRGRSRRNHIGAFGLRNKSGGAAFMPEVPSGEASMSRTVSGVLAFIVAFVALGIAFAVPSSAQDAPVRVRGAIDRVEGDLYIVKTRAGAELKVKFPDNVMVVALTKASLADIKQGSYVGVSGMPQPDGSQKALEVHIFPEAMRGTGQGHRGWDLQPSSTMTNGAVEEAAASSDGKTLLLRYKDGEKKISVGPDTPIVIYTPGEKSELKPGVPIFISAATKQADGTLTTPRVNVGRGVVPPM
jgi:hypothetical protein